jgi:YD repeat-containing protein
VGDDRHVAPLIAVYYDGAGNRTTLRDEKYPQHNQATAYVYDALNRLLSVTAPGSEVTGYQYDAHDNLVQATDPGDKGSYLKWIESFMRFPRFGGHLPPPSGRINFP